MNPKLAAVRITIPKRLQGRFLEAGLAHGIAARLVAQHGQDVTLAWPRPARLHLLTDWAEAHGLQPRLQASGGLRLVPRATAARAA